jgi:hypothetical protein
MTTFLWTIAILGLLEVGSSVAYFLIGRAPERTMTGVVINGVFWAVFAYWALSLIGSAA